MGCRGVGMEGDGRQGWKDTGCRQIGMEGHGVQSFRDGGMPGAPAGLPALTDGGDDRDGEVEGAGELPLAAGAVRLGLQHQPLQLPVVVGGEAVLMLRRMLRSWAGLGRAEAG